MVEFSDGNDVFCASTSKIQQITSVTPCCYIKGSDTSFRRSYLISCYRLEWAYSCTFRTAGWKHFSTQLTTHKYEGRKVVWANLKFQWYPKCEESTNRSCTCSQKSLQWSKLSEFYHSDYGWSFLTLSPCPHKTPDHSLLMSWSIQVSITYMVPNKYYFI